MALASGQFTIIDLNDFIVSATSPANPVLNQTWLNISVEPNQFNCWNGVEWVTVTDQAIIDALETRLNNRINTVNDAIAANGSDIAALQASYTTLFNVTIAGIYAEVAKKLNTNELISTINQTAAGILLQAIQTVDSVTTSTGYKFDKDGLEIESTESGVKIKIDNDEVTFSNLAGTEVIAQFTALLGALMSKIKVSGTAEMNNISFIPVVMPGTNEKRTWVVFNL
ncbi:MAG: hypothetical protein ACYC5K_07365 [Saccharofermentanales bacterium]